jgi:hypothetical protein
MAKFRMSAANVLAQIRHRPAKIKVLRHNDRSPDPSEVIPPFQSQIGTSATYEVTRFPTRSIARTKKPSLSDEQGFRMVSVQGTTLLRRCFHDWSSPLAGLHAVTVTDKFDHRPLGCITQSHG